MSTKLVIYNTLSFNTDNGIRFFSCKRLHFELGIVTTTTNGYHAPLISLSSTLQHDSLWFKIIYFQSLPTHGNESIKPWDGVYQRLKLCVSHTWNSVFHRLETVRFKAWDDAFHRMKPCVPCIETLRSMYWNDEFHRLRLVWNISDTGTDMHKKHEKKCAG